MQSVIKPQFFFLHKVIIKAEMLMPMQEDIVLLDLSVIQSLLGPN